MNDILAILALLAIPGSVFGAFVGMIYFTHKKSQREWAEEEAKDLAWLAAELEKPMFSIEFITLDGEKHTTGPHKPYSSTPGSKWGYNSTSKDFADRCLRNAYERGFFMDEERNSFPTCNVKSAKVVENAQA